ncbi:MAG TPA: UvrD-helicase domain-containing protein [Thermoleophilaceae bacterium]|nr:UvrD-helicase domain-containing protein [Thermoleophilaceae bacterium]
MTAPREFTDEQRRAIDRRDGPLLVRAGAGTGKTSVLVERFVSAVLEDGVAVDAILAITFTKKAASQMRSRVRRRLIDLGRRDLARDAERAWISTIHGLCARVLRAHALSAGIDPDFRVLDELEAERLGLDAFDRALGDFLGEGQDPARLEMAAAYTPDRLRDMVRTAYSRLRSRGERHPSLPESTPPAPAGERERLEQAAAAALRELGSENGKRVLEAVERLERCGRLLEGLAPGALADPGDLEKLSFAAGARALEGHACEEYREALAAYAKLCAAQRQHADHTLLRSLLELYGACYERLKRARSGLDFEDLELVARDLLAHDPGVRGSYAGRFAHVLVDELQDVNPLQHELFELLSRDNLFLVGDENQSIYGFRHADVDVFREQHGQAAGRERAESLTVNFRSRGEVLDAVDLVFSRLWGEGFEPLRERDGAREALPRVEPPVELIVVEKVRQRWDDHFGEEPEPFGAGLRTATPWRAAEARLLAKRVDELTGPDGPFELKDVVLLLRATTHMSVYERALEERGVRTHVVGGRGYWSQQQVGDLRHWLAALANPLDELALYSLLASPLVGASLDAVALLALESRRVGRDPWWTLREPDGLMELLPEDDRPRVERFVELFSAERRAAPQVSLETLIDRAVTATGYDTHILSLPAGDRRMANLRKLMRMAREFEADEGRDLRAFIDFVAERDMIQAREGEAPLEAEELDAVRLMTIHRAKGLEFPVVCVADLGKDGREEFGSLRISDAGEVGLRLASLGGGAVNTEELDRIKAEQKAASEDEERRIFYVAATRAQEHLIFSGATDLEKRPAAGALCEPMRWVWRGLCPDLPGEGASGLHVDEWEGREVAVRWQRCVPATLDELLSEADRAPVRPMPSAEAGFEQAPLELGAVPAPRAMPVSRLSYSALEAYRRCGYRFYLERTLGLPRRDVEHSALPELPAPEGLPALARGSIVHELLEGLDFERPQPPADEEIAAAIARQGLEPRDEDVADLRSLVAGFCASALCARLGQADRVRTELPFSFSLAPPEAAGRSLLVNGVVDVHAVENGRTLVVDYKSDPLDGASPDELVDEAYATQRLIYALAALRGGAPEVEVAYVLLERPDEPVSETYAASDADRLEGELLELARGLAEARFEPTPQPHRELCADCPGQPALCSWEPERTLEPAHG